MNYDQLASEEVLNETVTNLGARNFEAIVVQDKAEALAKIQELIPSGASVMNGTSRTLEEIGYVDLLKSGNHNWRNMHAEVLAEADPAKQAVLRRDAALSDYYLGSVHALSQTGEMVIASNTGSQLPSIAFTSPNLILVVSTQKITASLDEAMNRLHKQVIPLEDARMKSVYGEASGTYLSKLFIFNREPVFTGRKVRVILVKEKLGF